MRSWWFLRGCHSWLQISRCCHLRWTPGCRSWWEREPTLWGCNPHRITLCSPIQLPMCWSYNHETCTLLTRGWKEQSAYCFFFSLEDIISRWVAVAVNSFQPPHPIPIPTPTTTQPPAPTSCSVWRQIHWFPVSQWTCKGQFFLYEKEREENPLHFLCLICTTTSKWLQCYCALFMRNDLNLM